MDHTTRSLIQVAAATAAGAVLAGFATWAIITAIERFADLEARITELSGRLDGRIDSLEYQVSAIAADQEATAPAPASALMLDNLDAAGTSYGPADALVTIVEFSDFECPYCAMLQPTLEQAREQYGDQIRFVFRHFPLTSIHPNAWKAAEASLCAGEQGRFWDLHGAMFADQEALDVPSLKATARQLGLDGAAFDECLDTDRYYAAVETDVRAGDAAGVAGTPAMFINRRHLSGALPYYELQAAIDAAITAQE